MSAYKLETDKMDHQQRERETAMRRKVHGTTATVQQRLVQRRRPLFTRREYAALVVAVTFGVTSAMCGCLALWLLYHPFSGSLDSSELAQSLGIRIPTTLSAELHSTMGAVKVRLRTAAAIRVGGLCCWGFTHTLAVPVCACPCRRSCKRTRPRIAFESLATPRAHGRTWPPTPDCPPW